MPEVDVSLETSAKCRKRMRQSFEAERKENEKKTRAQNEAEEGQDRQAEQVQSEAGKGSNEKQFAMSKDKCNLEACFPKE